MARLRVRLIDSCAAGGRAYAVCDDNGEPLPGQLACDISSAPDATTVTVKLFVDGRDVVLGDEDVFEVEYRPLSGGQARTKTIRR